MSAFFALLLAASPLAPVATLAKPVEVSADRLEVHGKQNQAVYSGHALAKRDSATISCERILVHFRGKEILRVEAEGGVEVTDGDRWARGEKADFDNLSGVLVVSGKPQAKQGQNHVAGSKVTFTVGSDLLEVEDARTLFEEAPGALAGRANRVRIDAKRLAVEGKKSQAVWSGAVRARRGTTEIASEELVALYENDQVLTRLLARRGVEVKDGELWAKGAKADFDNQKGVLVLTGNPEARQGRNHMRGSKVVFTVGSDRLEVENARTVIEAEGAMPKLPGGRK